MKFRKILIHALIYSIVFNIFAELGFPKESYFILGLIQGAWIAIEIYEGE